MSTNKPHAAPPYQTKANLIFAVIGRGPAGMLTALALSKKNIIVKLFGASSPLEDYRTTALMQPAIKFLQEMGIWHELISKSAPLEEMQIIDATKRLIRSQPISFSPKEIGQENFGYNIPNLALNNAISKQIKQSSLIEIIEQDVTCYNKTENGISVETKNSHHQVDFVIAADGRQSIARHFSGIEIQQWSYPQTAVVLNFQHQFPHRQISREFHTEYGPCTQVPLPQQSSSLVYVVPPEKAQALLNLTAEELALHIEEKLCSILGKVDIISPVQGWPLSAMKAKSYAKNNILLVGEAAHYFPPIGAQGLNLSIRDIQDLIESILHYNLHQSETLCQLYNRKRQADIWSRTITIDLLNRSLLSESLLNQMLRSFSFTLLKNIRPLRRLFMQEGMHPSKISRLFFNAFINPFKG